MVVAYGWRGSRCHHNADQHAPLLRQISKDQFLPACPVCAGPNPTRHTKRARRKGDEQVFVSPTRGMAAMEEHGEPVLYHMRVKGKHGAKLREGIDLESAEIPCASDNGSIFPKGTIVHVVAETTTSDGRPIRTGTNCTRAGLTLLTLPLLPGYWRLTNSSTIVHECNVAYGCLGTKAFQNRRVSQ